MMEEVQIGSACKKFGAWWTSGVGGGGGSGNGAIGGGGGLESLIIDYRQA
jgi:hypothetical protein